MNVKKIYIYIYIHSLVINNSHHRNDKDELGNINLLLFLQHFYLNALNILI